MKKTIITSLFLLFSFGIFAQNQVRISYVSPDSIPSATLDLMDFLREDFANQSLLTMIREIL